MPFLSSSSSQCVGGYWLRFLVYYLEFSHNVSQICLLVLYCERVAFLFLSLSSWCAWWSEACWWFVWEFRPPWLGPRWWPQILSLPQMANHQHFYYSCQQDMGATAGSLNKTVCVFVCLFAAGGRVGRDLPSVPASGLGAIQSEGDD